MRTEFLGRETPELILSAPSSKQTYVSKFNPAMHAERKWFGEYMYSERNAPKGLIINHIIIIASVLL